MIQQIKSYIVKGKTKEAINLLRSFETTHPKLEKEILSIASRYNIHVSNTVKGILDNNEINIERAKIHDSILVICELIEKSTKNENTKKRLNRRKLKYSLFVLPCLIVAMILFHSSIKNYQVSLNSDSKSETYPKHNEHQSHIVRASSSDVPDDGNSLLSAKKQSTFVDVNSDNDSDVNYQGSVKHSTHSPKIITKNTNDVQYFEYANHQESVNPEPETIPSKRKFLSDSRIASLANMNNDTCLIISYKDSVKYLNLASMSFSNFTNSTDNQGYRDINGDDLPDILRSNSIDYSKLSIGSSVTSNELGKNIYIKDSLIKSVPMGNYPVAMGANAIAIGGNYSDTTKSYGGFHSNAQGMISNTINYNFDPKLNATESFNTGMAFNRIGHYRTAELNFTKAIQDSLGFVEAYLNRGIMNRKTQNYENAVEDYNTALELSPNNPAILISRSVVYLRINELDKAMEDCNLAIQINPSLAEAYNSKGNILFVQGLYEEAIVEYNKALELKKYLYSYSLIGRGMAKYKLHEDSSDVYCADILKAIKLNRSLNLSPFNEICK